ncbi:helix-turn-helix domain-containing protein [Kingella kingae]|uniref:helix-turn-helix domain-containing protein n=1 Tax=Kingella kingae TaxID=504 RepID=UPI00254FF998|nr:helix-turn-helix domain-containing protein [Kingella kingae]MDK4545161.1 helix-turn-helix domain-containing protein [Kingella kingae]MDK4631352.1 helix-turn-helix domain-containing protein [Kingella kingae]MDK4657220.1 helix-turn-helix domain-containing protein [Kingella kingae]
MSIKLMSKAWDLAIPQGQKFVLIALCDHANDDGVCYPSQNKLAEKCSMSDRAVLNHIKWLEQQGFISKERRQSSQRRYSDLYQIFLEPANSAPANSAPANSAPANSAPEPENFAPTEPENSAGSYIKKEPSVINRQIEPSVVSTYTPEYVPKKQPAQANAQTLLAEFGIDGDLADDYIAHRKAKRATVSKTVLQTLQTEAQKAGMTIQQAVQYQLSQGWTGFVADWVFNRMGVNGSATKQPAHGINTVKPHTNGGLQEWD